MQHSILKYLFLFFVALLTSCEFDSTPQDPIIGYWVLKSENDNGYIHQPIWIDDFLFQPCVNGVCDGINYTEFASANGYTSPMIDTFTWKREGNSLHLIWQPGGWDDYTITYLTQDSLVLYEPLGGESSSFSKK